MLPSLSIKNFRNLEDLKIESLGRINLITGKNNTGKSTLLEAISIYASRCDLAWINSLLNERGEYLIPMENTLNSVDLTVKTFAALFSHRLINFTENDSLSIGVINDFKQGVESQTLDKVSIKFVTYSYQEHEDSQIMIGKNQDRYSHPSTGMGLQLTGGGHLLTLLFYNVELLRSVYRSGVTSDNFQFIRVRNIDKEINGKLWDTITLTDKESHVIDALKIIEPNIERLAFIGDEGRERTAVVKLKGDNSINPIRSMGDGINRILTIILALVNSDNGYLLIDEFENGLHYSVQEKLWEIIFKLSKKLNVQVFATTHSEDCIRGFEGTLNDVQNFGEGKLIRLDNHNGKIRQTEYTSEELKVAAENYIETR